jgi:predicted ATPase/DNA-binding winged helix-turn-helix (wHTH) protein
VILFGGFRLSPSTRALTRDGTPVHLGARALDILIALIGRAGEVVSKAELFAIVWPNLFIEESNLRVHIASLRKALGDSQSGPRFITSVSGRGYVFVAKAERISAGMEVAGTAQSTLSSRREGSSASLIKIVGRDEIVAEIADQLPRSRFITITGTGGIGKTAVALAIAAKLAAGYRDGVRFVDFGPLTSRDVVVAHLASFLRLPSPDTQPLHDVISYLLTRSLLLVLDNCEHVIGPVSQIAEAIHKQAPGVEILATSRESLRTAGEWVKRLEPLTVPLIPMRLTAADALRFSAVQLFVERLAACDGSYELTDANAATVAEICSKLDGMPLAIELAATRVPLFGLRGLAERLDDRLSILTKGRRTAAPRHQTLAAMIDWSYETLSEDEKIVWRRLSVCRAPFTLEAAIAVAKDPLTDTFNMVEVLDNLIEKSLVSGDTHGSAAKYRLLESFRLYALDKLLGNEESECVRRRHAQYWYDCSIGSGDNWIEIPTAEWLAQHSGDVADIRAALDWAFDSPGDPILGIRIVTASAPYWFKTLLLPELRRYLEHALKLASDFPEIGDQLLMRLHVALAHSIFHTLGPVREVGEALSKAADIAERLGDAPSQLQALWALFGNSSTKGDYADMMSSLARTADVVARYPELAIAAPMYDRMAALGYHLVGEQEKALHHAQRSLQYPAVQRHDGGFVYDHKTATSSHYSRVLWLGGRPDAAAEVIRSTIEHALAINQPFAFGYFLVFGACPVSIWSGDLDSLRKHVSLLSDEAVGVPLTIWRVGGEFYERVLSFLEAADKRAALHRLKPIETSLTPSQAEGLTTFNWQLLHPESLAQAMEGNVNWCTAEVLRAQGETLLTSGNADAWSEAERLFLRSMEISRQQKALSWELRSASSLARVWHSGGRTRQARDLLNDVYGRFTEGFATRDLVEAKTLLEALY